MSTEETLRKAAAAVSGELRHIGPHLPETLGQWLAHLAAILEDAQQGDETPLLPMRVSDGVLEWGDGAESDGEDPEGLYV